MAPLLSTLLFLFSALPVGDLNLVPAESNLSYKVIHKFHEVNGKTSSLEGRALIEKESEGRVMVRAQVSSFDSGNANRDAHMKEVVEAHKFSHVVVKGMITPVEDKTVHISGTLDFHGVTQPIEMNLPLEKIGEKWKLHLSFPVSLTQFKIERPSLLFVKVNDQIQIEGDLVFSATQ